MEALQVRDTDKQSYVFYGRRRLDRRERPSGLLSPPHQRDLVSVRNASLERIYEQDCSPYARLVTNGLLNPIGCIR